MNNNPTTTTNSNNVTNNTNWCNKSISQTQQAMNAANCNPQLNECQSKQLVNLINEQIGKETALEAEIEEAGNLISEAKQSFKYNLNNLQILHNNHNNQNQFTNDENNNNQKQILHNNHNQFTNDENNNNQKQFNTRENNDHIFTSNNENNYNTYANFNSNFNI